MIVEHLDLVKQRPPRHGAAPLTSGSSSSVLIVPKKLSLIALSRRSPLWLMLQAMPWSATTPPPPLPAACRVRQAAH